METLLQQVRALKTSLDHAESLGYHISPELYRLLEDYRFVINAFEQVQEENNKLYTRIRRLEDRLFDLGQRGDL